LKKHQKFDLIMIFFYYVYGIFASVSFGGIENRCYGIIIGSKIAIFWEDILWHFSENGKEMCLLLTYDHCSGLFWMVDTRKWSFKY